MPEVNRLLVVNNPSGLSQRKNCLQYALMAASDRSWDHWIYHCRNLAKAGDCLHTRPVE
jgi:hypothetical protein